MFVEKTLMKRDWTKPGMRLSVDGYGNFAFLLFLRLGLVTAFCLIGPLLISKAYGQTIGVISAVAVFPVWWWHFGLPRFKERSGSGFFSPGFCLVGYVFMTLQLAVLLLQKFGVLKEGQRHPFPDWVPRSHTARFLIIFALLLVFEFIYRKFRKRGS